jgi:hypothetical protein
MNPFMKTDPLIFFAELGHARLCVLHAMGNMQQPTGNTQQAFASYHE